MTLPRRIALGALRWLALLIAILTATLQLADPDLASVLVGGPFGSPRTAVFAGFVFALVAAVAAYALTPLSERTSRRRVALGVVLATLPLLALQITRRVRSNFTQETVRYASADGTPLEATLYRPTNGGRHAAVVFVHGSPPILRGAYDLWAESIARQGLIVLLSDKRGVGGSGGEFDRQDNTGPANIQRLSEDVVAGVDHLSRREDVRKDRIGLVGISQAGWVGTAAAARDTRIRFLALITAPTVSTREEAVWSRLRGDDQTGAVATRAQAERIMDTVSSRGVDARAYLHGINVPALWLFGENDNSIPSRRSMMVLDSFRLSGKPFSYRTYAGYGHALIGRGDGELFPRVAPASWIDLHDWLAAQSK